MEEKEEYNEKRSNKKYHDSVGSTSRKNSTQTKGKDHAQITRKKFHISSNRTEIHFDTVDLSNIYPPSFNFFSPLCTNFTIWGQAALIVPEREEY